MFASAVLAPGFCLGRLGKGEGFRCSGFREQMAWSVALSFGPGVLLTVAAVALGGATGGAFLLAALSVLALGLAWKHPPRFDLSRRQLFAVIAAFSVWGCVVLCSLVDVGTQSRLWMSVTAYDHGLRTAFVDAVLRSSVPPVNPVYRPGHDVAMRYYYFWYAVCAAVARLAHISGRQALIASCVWPPVGVVAMLALFARYLLGKCGRDLNRLTVTAAALFGVCGLDILVTLALQLIGTPVMADMEWWSIDQVASWPDTFLWVPHHAAALVAALLGLMLLLRTAEIEGWRTRMSVAMLAGSSFAAAFGLSAYLAVAAALVAVAVFLFKVREGSGWKYLQALVTAALTASFVLQRFLWQLLRPDGSAQARTAPLYVGLREILDPTALMNTGLLHSLAALHPLRAREVAASILLLPGWAVELGFYAVVLVIALRHLRAGSPGERIIVWLTLSGLAAASFLRSGVIVTNDYGIRSALLPQFFLLLLGALVFSYSAGKVRRFLWVLIAVGGAGCVYQLIALRTYLPWQEAHGNAELRDTGERTYALRNLYADMQSRTPNSARIQFDTAATGFFLYPHLLYANRQVVSAELACNTSFGGNAAECPAIQRDLRELYPIEPSAVPTAKKAAALCAELGAQYLVATRWDVAWRDRSGWVWTLPTVIGQDSARAVSCDITSTR